VSRDWKNLLWLDGDGKKSLLELRLLHLLRRHFHSFIHQADVQSDPSSPNCPKAVVKLVAKVIQIISPHTNTLVRDVLFPEEVLYDSIVFCMSRLSPLSLDESVKSPATKLIQTEILLHQKSSFTCVGLFP